MMPVPESTVVNRSTTARRALVGVAAAVTLGAWAGTADAAAPIDDPAPPQTTVAVPVSLPAIDVNCLQGTWTATPESLAALTLFDDPTSRVVGGTAALNISGTTFSWEADYTVESAAGAPTATVPMPGVVSQADVWWLQSGELVVAENTVSFATASATAGVSATRVFLDSSWIEFPGSDDPAAPVLGGGPLECAADHLALYLPAAGGGARLVLLERQPLR